MKKDIQKLKEKLDKLMSDLPLISDEVLKISRELDLIIIEYYRQ